MIYQVKNFMINQLIISMAKWVKMLFKRQPLYHDLGSTPTLTTLLRPWLRPWLRP